METEAVKALIQQGLPEADITVTGDGRHFDAIIISSEFEGKSLIQRHKMVMATVRDEITSDTLHALSIKAFTPEQAQ